jgi:hypothetical protein
MSDNFWIMLAVIIAIVAIITGFFYPVIVWGIVGVIVSMLTHYLKHEPRMRKRLFVFPWVAGTVLTIIGAIVFQPSLWLVFAGLIFAPWALYLIAYLIWNEQVKKSQEERKINDQKWKDMMLERDRKLEMDRQQEQIRQKENEAFIEPWAQQLYLLAKNTLHDLNVDGSEARVIGEEICAKGGFELMQKVIGRVRGIERERREGYGFAVPTVERWWDGIGNWRA